MSLTATLEIIFRNKTTHIGIDTTAPRTKSGT